MNKLVSIVIPMFNAQEYLTECIDSVLAQNYETIEVIFIDDGSVDDTAKICEAYCDKYSFMFLHKQVNQGPGAARNKGIELAKGKYVCFLDADDCLDGEAAISKLVQSAENKQADIVCGSFRLLTENGLSNVNYHHLDELDRYDTVEFRFRGFFQYGHLGFNWGKLYRKQFILDNQLLIPNYSFVEDKAFNMRCCLCQPNFSFVQESVYIYRFSNRGVVFQNKKDFSEVWTKMTSELDEFVIQRKNNELYTDMQAFHTFLGLYSLGIKKLSVPDIKVREINKALSDYGQIPCVKKYIKQLAKGKYINQIKPLGWKMVIRIISIICSWNGYLLLALGMCIMKGLGIDKKVVSKKYSRKE